MDFPYELGTNVIIRTVTYHYTGTVAGFAGDFVKLDDAAWIAESDRWADTLRNGSLYEVEPYPNETWVSVNTIVDVTRWTHPLPRDQK